MFQQISIIGFGLIGSSIARGIKKHELSHKIICVDQNEEVNSTVLALDLADETTPHLSEGVKASDLIIICTPVGAMGKVAEKISPFLEEGAIVTDVGSVKMSVIKALQPRLPACVHFVPGHPIAGTEFSGPENGFAELFENRWAVLTPQGHTELQAIERVTQFWEALGSNVEIMDPAHHDLVLGITSHLPHLIAYNIIGTASDLEDDIKSEVIKFSASGFRDFTRIASSDPVMWRDVFLHNKDAVLDVLQRFSEDLSALQKAIRRENGDYLHEVFEKTRNIRQEIIDAGQADYIYPEDKRGIVSTKVKSED